jgi:hypothetical protein
MGDPFCTKHIGNDVITSYEDAIGENVSKLVEASFRFRNETHLCMLDKSKLKQAMEHRAFAEICEIHDELKKHGDHTSVPDFFLELVDKKQGMSFLIVYAYFARKVPERYSRHNTRVGDGWALPMILESLGL